MPQKTETTDMEKDSFLEKPMLPAIAQKNQKKKQFRTSQQLPKTVQNGNLARNGFHAKTLLTITLLLALFYPIYSPVFRLDSKSVLWDNPAKQDSTPHHSSKALYARSALILVYSL